MVTNKNEIKAITITLNLFLQSIIIRPMMIALSFQLNLIHLKVIGLKILNWPSSIMIKFKFTLCFLKSNILKFPLTTLLDTKVPVEIRWGFKAQNTASSKRTIINCSLEVLRRIERRRQATWKKTLALIFKKAIRRIREWLFIFFLFMNHDPLTRIKQWRVHGHFQTKCFQDHFERRDANLQQSQNLRKRFVKQRPRTRYKLQHFNSPEILQ